MLQVTAPFEAPMTLALKIASRPGPRVRPEGVISTSTVEPSGPTPASPTSPVEGIGCCCCEPPSDPPIVLDASSTGFGPASGESCWDVACVLLPHATKRAAETATAEA